MRKLLAALVLLLPGPAPGADDAPKLRLLVPAYFYPAGDGAREWDRLLQSEAQSWTVAIVNPASGPGEAADPNYSAILDRAKRSKASLIGYVTVGYGKRPIQDVEADVDRWVHLYPGIRGIFFDEQASGEDKVEYQAELYRYVRERKKLGLVVTNPGTASAERYLSRPAADAACLFEGPLPSGEFPLPPYAARYAGKARVAALPYGVGSAGRMRQVVDSAVARGVGYLYVTDSGGAMPWGRLPRYWDEEAASIARANGARAK